MPSPFKLDDQANANWFFGDATEWTSPPWMPDSFDEFWLRSVGIDPM